MRDRVLAFLLIGSLIAGFSSCRNNSDYTYQIAVVDSLQISLDEAVLAYDQWNLDSLRVIKNNMDSKLQELTNIFKLEKDTIAKDDGIFLGAYKSASKAFKSTGQNDRKFKEEIDISNTQLANLRINIKNKRLNEEEIMSYLSDEKKAVTRLIAGLEKFNKRYELGTDQYNRMTHRVDSLITVLKSRNDY